jgi:hypothetical protein
MTTGCGTQQRAYISTTPYFEAKPLLCIRIHNNVSFLVQIQRYLVIAAVGNVFCNATNLYKQN